MKRNGAIDFLKFLCAIIIVIFHGKNFGEPGEYIFIGGSIVVEFFFVVSGFLMAMSVRKYTIDQENTLGDNTMHFMGKKIKTLLPNIWVAWVISFVVNAIFGQWGGRMIIEKGTSAISEVLFVSQSGILGYRSNSVSWYISAMLIAMLILFPILLKTRKTFLLVIAPVITLLFYGYMFQTFEGALGGPNNWLGFMLKGLFRAIAAISFGCVCYAVVQKMDNLKPTKLLSALITVLALLCLLAIGVGAYFTAHTRLDYLMVLMMGISITLIFSQKGLLTKHFNHAAFSWLGKFSLDLYLSHGFWSHYMMEIFPGESYWQILPKYLLIVLCTALCVKYISKGISALCVATWPKLKSKLLI